MRASSILAAGTCRCTTARKKKSTTPCARKAGLFDVSHMTIVDLKGERVAQFLQHLLANDVAKLKDCWQGSLHLHAE